jgi:hypothetical protein
MKTETCSERIQDNFNSRRNDIRLMLGDISLDDIEVYETEKTIEVLDIDLSIEVNDMEDYIDSEGETDFEALWADYEDEIREQAYERFCEFGLAWSWEGDHYCYLLSTGGPHDEIRFYPERVVYVFQDWFDGAEMDVTSDSVMETLRYYFFDNGMLSWEDYNG